MLEFNWPWAFFLLPLPLLSWALLPAAARQQSALMVPFFAQLQQQSQAQQENPSSLLRALWLLLVWLLLLSAVARPQWLGEAINLPASGRDLLIAVDISGSMKTPDMKLEGKAVTRLQVVKQVVGDFVERRKNDRLGLVLFGSQAYLQAPLTFDRNTVKLLLNEAQLGFAGEKTAIGDAIGLAIKRLRLRPADSRVLILLTDGANTSGEVSPMQAAKLAEQTQVKIYTIGVGADEMQTGGIFGTSFGRRTVNPSADLDEKSLLAMAQLTGGQYFRARNPQELQAIYQQLDKLEPIEQEQETFRPISSLFHWPLALACFLYFTGLIAALIKNALGSSSGASSQ